MAKKYSFFQPLAGWRRVEVTERRTKRHSARCMKELVDVHFPDADKIRVVLYNLNTHTLAALYEAFDATEAHRSVHKLEFRCTPKHGSWLNMAEIERALVRSTGGATWLSSRSRLSVLSPIAESGHSRLRQLLRKISGPSFS